MTEAEIVKTLRDLSHDPRVAGKSMRRFGRMADVLRLVANEIETLGPLEPVESGELCGASWQYAPEGPGTAKPTAHWIKCVRRINHPRNDLPFAAGGGHTAREEWTGR